MLSIIRDYIESHVDDIRREPELWLTAGIASLMTFIIWFSHLIIVWFNSLTIAVMSTCIVVFILWGVTCFYRFILGLITGR